MSVNKMKKHWITLKLNYIISFMWNFISLLSVNYDFAFRSSFCLPFGKAKDTPSPALGRWLKWIAGIAKPSGLIRRLFTISKESMDRVEKVKDIENKIAHTGAQPFKRAARNLLILQALAKVIGYTANGFQSMVECAIFNRNGVTTYDDPFIPELAR
jgi:hypothetical protein